MNKVIGIAPERGIGKPSNEGSIWVKSEKDGLWYKTNDINSVNKSVVTQQGIESDILNGFLKVLNDDS